MKEPKSGNWQKYIRLGLFSVSLIPVVIYFFLLSQRLLIPFDLEWGEGAGINQIQRLVSGRILYSEPTLEFAPLVYTPFYYWVSSLLARLINDINLAGRIVSAIASLGAAGIIIWLVGRETKDGLVAWLSGALYLACFQLSDGFYDLVRVDSLYVFILLAVFAGLLSVRKPWSVVIAGLGIALGFFTKQSALIVFAPLILYLLISKWKLYWTLIPAVGLGIAVPFGLINLRTEGWFYYYLIKLPGEHGYSILSAAEFWVNDLIGPLGIALAVGLIALIFRKDNSTDQEQIHDPTSVPGPRINESTNRILVFGFFVVGAIAAAWITRASNGGGANNSMSAYAGLALMFGLGCSKAGELIKGGKGQTERAQLVLSSLVIIQFLGLIYNPFSFLPTQEEMDANQDLIEMMAKTEGTILIPYRSHLPHQAGKDSMIHAVNLFELTGYFMGDILPEGRALVNSIQEEICQQTYGLVVLDQPIAWFDAQLKEAYQIDKSYGSFEKNSRSHLLTWQNGLNAVYVPQDNYDPTSCLKSIMPKSEE